MFQAIYDSPWQNPALFWAAGIVFLAWWFRARPFLTAFFALFTVEILADALATGGWSPLTLLRSSFASPIAIAFVILGDFRYFLLVERWVRLPSARPGDATPRAAWLVAVGFSLIVPIGSAIAARTIPAATKDARWTFLVYEAMFAALAIWLRFGRLPRALAAAPPAVRRWLFEVTTFEIVQYVLWATADVIILAGHDAGFALRLIPNTMYYALFLPFVAKTAPAEVDERGAERA